jgi:hypothetical protein
VTAIWADAGDSWSLLSAAGFPSEASLHEIVATSPELLPLSGSPSLAVVGREVLLGSGYADVLAIESTGRPVVVEVKLRNNSESRRAVVAQILAYASALHGLTQQELERDVLSRHLQGRSLLDVVRESEATQEGVDAEAFAEELSVSLRDGAFRLVLVLDEAPDELVGLVGYLESVAEVITVDLITVTAYQLGERRIIVPQRVAPEPPRRMGSDEAPAQSRTGGLARRGHSVAGVAPFAGAIPNAPPEMQPALVRLSELGERLQVERLADVSTYFGKRGEVTLLPRLRPDNAGLVTFWQWTDGRALVTPYRTVFERRAPNSIVGFEQAAAPARLGQGNEVSTITDELIDAVYHAYLEANGRARPSADGLGPETDRI